MLCFVLLKDGHISIFHIITATETCNTKHGLAPSGEHDIFCYHGSLQGILEFMFPDDHYHVILPGEEYDIFGHGGMLFWFASSIFFFVVSSTLIRFHLSMYRVGFYNWFKL